MTASSRVPISPRCSRSRSALKEASNRRLKPIITRGLPPAISLQHACARSRSRSTGFSHSTALPALTADAINGTWVSVGVATRTPPTSPADRTSSTLRAIFTPNSAAVCCAASARMSNTIKSLARGCRARFRACIRPVPARCEYLDDEEPLGRRARRQHVANIAGIGARAPHLLADIVRPDQPRREPAFGRRRAHRQLAAGLRLEDQLRSRRRIDRKRLAVEGTAPCADRAEGLTIDADGCAPGEQHETLLPLGDLP